jgi:hypothetical protein
MEMHKQVMLPKEVSMPDAYSLWLQCKDLGHLYVDGGISQQPHIMLMEFNVCRATTHRFAESQVRGI